MRGGQSRSTLPRDVNHVSSVADGPCCTASGRRSSGSTASGNRASGDNGGVVNADIAAAAAAAAASDRGRISANCRIPARATVSGDHPAGVVQRKHAQNQAGSAAAAAA